MNDGQDPREMREMVTITRPNGTEFVMDLRSARIRRYHMNNGKNRLVEIIERWKKAIRKARRHKWKEAKIKTPVGDEIQVGLEVAKKRVSDWEKNLKASIETIERWDAAIMVALEA